MTSCVCLLSQGQEGAAHKSKKQEWPFARVSGLLCTLAVCCTVCALCRACVISDACADWIIAVDCACLESQNLAVWSPYFVKKSASGGAPQAGGAKNRTELSIFGSQSCLRRFFEKWSTNVIQPTWSKVAILELFSVLNCGHPLASKLGSVPILV